jgi:serine/threonine protein kinase
MTICPLCGYETDTGVQVCFQCGRYLGAAVTRGTVVAGRYEVMSPLGQAGSGTLYEAHDRDGGEMVVLEVLRPEWHQKPERAQRFLLQMKTLQSVRHPNVCRTLDSGEDEGIYFHVLEFVEGTNLKHLVREQGGLPRDEAYNVCIQIARGLQALHRVGVVHRNVKTSNVIVAKNGRAKLTGFDIVKGLASAARPRTMTGSALGTVDYMSPEQIRSEAIDFPSDIYSLGVVIYEVFTGKLPFRAPTSYGTVMKHLNEPPPLEGPAAARIPQSLVPVLKKALAKEPGHRHQMVRHLGEALRVAKREGAVEDPMALLAALNPVDATVKIDLSQVRALTEPSPEIDRPTLLKVLRGDETEAPPTAPGEGGAPRPASRPTVQTAGPPPAVAIHLLLQALREKSERERIEAFDALGLMGPDTHAALTSALTDDDPVIRQIAGDAIRRILSRVRPPGGGTGSG